ncbi:FecR family protein [Salipiger abyssi]|uniref:FecR family protein n=1 Tax=Salipiger abyssi TaxID=1250539 RepID=UPI0040583C5E
MPDQDRKALIAEASDIFIRLREDPDNPDLLALRQAFRQRGRAERDIYDRVARAWEGAGRRTGPGKALTVILVCVLVASACFLARPVRNHILSDITTRFAPRRVELASGDQATLDAHTALADDSAGTERRLKLFAGAAVFDVLRDGRSFVVAAGALEIEVLGTSFEVAHIGDMIRVSVREGTVHVSGKGVDVQLEKGQRLSWSDDTGATLAEVDPDAVALWRQDRFLADGLTLAQIADVIDRRLPGRILVAGTALARSRVSGTINLGNPELALRALAATRGASVLPVPGLGTLVLP